MVKRIKHTITAFLAAFLLMAALVVQAVTLDQAVAQVRSQTGGKVLSAKTIRRGDTRIHRIKVLTPKGKVRIVEVPAGGRR